MKKTVLIFMTTLSLLFAQGMQKGELAPQFSLVDQNGNNHSFSSNIGTKYTILVFYPGDNTLRCTEQLCELRDNYETLTESDSVAIWGINSASQESHLEFAKEQNYNFPLLIDENWDVAELFGVKGGLFGVKRWVFIISPSGEIIYSQKGKPPVEDFIEMIP